MITPRALASKLLHGAVNIEDFRAYMAFSSAYGFKPEFEITEDVIAYLLELGL